MISLIYLSKHTNPPYPAFTGKIWEGKINLSARNLGRRLTSTRNESTPD
jgi:hypothetical protein